MTKLSGFLTAAGLSLGTAFYASAQDAAPVDVTAKFPPLSTTDVCVKQAMVDTFVPVSGPGRFHEDDFSDSYNRPAGSASVIEWYALDKDRAGPHARVDMDTNNGVVATALVGIIEGDGVGAARLRFNHGTTGLEYIGDAPALKEQAQKLLTTLDEKVRACFIPMA